MIRLVRSYKFSGKGCSDTQFANFSMPSFMTSRNAFAYLWNGCDTFFKTVKKGVLMSGGSLFLSSTSSLSSSSSSFSSSSSSFLFPLGEVLLSVEKVKKKARVISHRTHGKVSPLPTTFLFPDGSVRFEVTSHNTPLRRKGVVALRS